MATCSRIFVVACDMPFLNHEMIRFFAERNPEADVVMGRLPIGLQPLHALYGKEALPVVERMARARHLKIQDIVAEPSLKVAVIDASEWSHIDPASRSFQNVNTPEDLLAARAEASRSPLAQ
jgi:molybdopterin-guanine dinucleotide biosynthesis protein A